MKLKILNKKIKGIDKIFLILLIFSLVYSTWQIGGAIRTIDTIHNFEYLEDELNITIQDRGSDNIERPLSAYYANSMNDLKKYTLYSILLSLSIGALIGVNYGNRRKTR